MYYLYVYNYLSSLYIIPMITATIDIIMHRHTIYSVAIKLA